VLFSTPAKNVHPENSSSFILFKYSQIIITN
jgi:hypothetical protein